MIQSILENLLKARYWGKGEIWQKQDWWTLPESNRRPTDNEAGALLTELPRCEAIQAKKLQSDLK